MFEQIKAANGDVINTGILNHIMEFPTHAGDIMAAFADSVDFSFLAGGAIILVLVVIGIIFKAETPDVDEEFEEAKKKVESGE